MRKVDSTTDYGGRKIERGDTVTTLNGQETARVCDIARDDELSFVRLRPLHQPYGPGVWHAADQVVWVATGSRRKRAQRNASSNGQASSDGQTSNGQSSADKTTSRKNEQPQ